VGSLPEPPPPKYVCVNNFELLVKNALALFLGGASHFLYRKHIKLVYSRVGVNRDLFAPGLLRCFCYLWPRPRGGKMSDIKPLEVRGTLKECPQQPLPPCIADYSRSSQARVQTQRNNTFKIECTATAPPPAPGDPPAPRTCIVSPVLCLCFVLCHPLSHHIFHHVKLFLSFISAAALD
jgi:hypothetical protein